MKTENGYRSAKRLSFLLLASMIYFGAGAQSVTEIVTDYNGYWRSAANAISPVQPDNHHNLVSFSFNGTRYSTGVNDQLLEANNLPFVAGVFQALPLKNFTGALTSNTKIGLGAMVDGVANGPSNPPPSRAIAPYLTDGENGLDLGTCVANLPAGTMFLSVSNIQPEAIGDGIPDIVVTQIADPSSSMDRYEFTDINGNRVGDFRNINLTNIARVGTWKADFYETTGSTILSSGFTNTPRDIRLWAADFSDFGINAENVGQIAYFKIGLSGNSDIAFVAYNTTTLEINQMLPVKFLNFNARLNNSDVALSWKTAEANPAAPYIIEGSRDGVNFEAIGSVDHRNGIQQYAYTVANAEFSYYRIKQADITGIDSYSQIAVVSLKPSVKAANIYPNPAWKEVYVAHAAAEGNEKILLYNMQGALLTQTLVARGSVRQTLDVQGLPKGAYNLVMTNGQSRTATLLIIK